MKKSAALLLAVLLVLSLFSGCASSEKNAAETTSATTAAATTAAAPAESTSAGSDVTAASGQTVVTVWVNGGEDAYIPCVAAAFEAAHPEIKLDMLYVPQEECFQKIVTTISTGGTLPDIVDVNLDDVGQLMDMDLWEDLSKAPYSFDSSQVLPYMLPAMTNSKGEVVSLMADLTTCTVAYDRALAKQYLGTDDPDQLAAKLNSNQAYIDVGKQVTEQSGGKVFAFASAQDAFNMMYAEAVQDAFVVDNKLNIDNSIGAAFQFIEDLTKNGSLDLYEQWSSEWVSNISNSTTMFYACPLWFVNWGLASNDSVGGGRWGVINPPSGSTQGGEMFLIPKASEDGKKQAAYKFLSWLCATREGAEAFYKGTGMLSGYIGNLSGDDVYYSTSNDAYGGQNVMGVFLSVAKMDTTKIRPLTKYDSGIFDSSLAVLSDLSQGTSAEDALKAVKKDVASKYPDLIVE